MLEFLYRNKGDGTFEEVGLTAEIAVDGDGHTYAGMGVDFQDYDNDGCPILSSPILPTRSTPSTTTAEIPALPTTAT